MDARNALSKKKSVEWQGPIAQMSLIIVAYLLATSKWGAHVLPGPPYIADIALAGSLVVTYVKYCIVRSFPFGPDDSTTVVLILLLGWTLLILVAGDASRESLRDAAPYGYAVIAGFAVPLTAKQQRVGVRIVLWALIFHAAWVTVSLVTDIRSSMPSLAPEPGGASPVPIMGIRTDIDALSAGLLAGVALYRVSIGRGRPGVNGILLAWGCALVLANSSRASLLATVAIIGIILWAVTVREEGPSIIQRQARVRTRSGVTVLLIAVVGAVVVVPEATSVERLPFVGSEERGQVSITEGTAGARLESWGLVIEWVQADWARVVFGGGFGTHYMAESAALASVGGGADRLSVRSVHNFGINTVARMGLVGLGLMLAVIVVAARNLRTVVHHVALPSELDAFAAGAFVGILVVATFGVVLEAPFGAIPFFWAVGYLGRRARQVRLIKKGGDQARQRLISGLRPQVSGS